MRLTRFQKKAADGLLSPVVPWLTGPITMKSNLELFTEAGALVLFSTDKNLYPLVATNFEGFNTYRCSSPVNGRNLENVAITGRGVFDGSGDVWRAVKKEKLTDSQWKNLVSLRRIVKRKWQNMVSFRAIQGGGKTGGI